jgi:hypothetical protein
MTESATGMMPAVMGDEGPGAQDPLIGQHRKRSAAVPALRFALYHTALPSHPFAHVHNFVCRASFSHVVPLHCAPCGYVVL